MKNFLFLVGGIEYASIFSLFLLGGIKTKVFFLFIVSFFVTCALIKQKNNDLVNKRAPFEEKRTVRFMSDRRKCVKEIAPPKGLYEIPKAASNNISSSNRNSNMPERPNAQSRKRSGKIATDSLALNKLETASLQTSSAFLKSEEVFDGSKCNFSLNFIINNCKIQDNGLVLPKQYPSGQFKNCLTFNLQEGHGLPFKLQQEFFKYITTGRNFADYSNGKSDWSRLPNISKSSSRMSIWKPMVRPMSVQFENQSLISSLEARDFLLGLDSLDLGRLQSLIFFSSRSEKIGKKGKVMVVVSLDSSRQTCAINLGSLIIPQFTDKALLKKQIIELLKNDNPFQEKKSLFNDSRKEANENVVKTKDLNDNDFKIPKLINSNDRKPLLQKRTKADLTSLSSHSNSASETIKATKSMRTLITKTQSIPESDPLFIENPKSKDNRKTKKSEIMVAKRTIGKYEKPRPQWRPKVGIASSLNHSSSVNSATTTTLTTVPQTTPETATQFIKNPFIYNESLNLESMYTMFGLIVNSIYPSSFESCFNRLEYWLKNDLVEYIALDCEMTGLYTKTDDERHSLNLSTLYIDNTKQIKDGVKVNSIFQLGLVIKIRQGGWSTWSFHTAPELTKESFTPSTFKFLFEDPLTEQNPTILPRELACMISEKLETISSNSISHEQLASLAYILLNSSSPLIVYSGFADLLYLFKAVGRNVDELNHDALQAYLRNRIFDLKSVCLSVPIYVAGKPSLFSYFHAFYSHLQGNKFSLHNASFDAVLTAMLYEALEIRHPLGLHTHNGLFSFE